MTMAIREIIKLPDKRLRLVSEPVKQIDAGIRKLVDDMFETMYKAPGIGLAAIQLGVAKRVITMDLSKKEQDHEPQVFINPEITWLSEERAKFEEGCLSIPDYYEEVERPAAVKVKYLDLAGKKHEIDHINGVLFIDHLSKLKRDRVIKKFTKAAKNAPKDAPKDTSKDAPKDTSKNTPKDTPKNTPETSATKKVEA